jgi:hypothetical protein
MLARRVFAFVVAALVGISPVLALQEKAPDLTGTWTGKFSVVSQGEKQEGAYVILKQTGSELSGSVGPSAERQQAINKGAVVTSKDGTTVTFDTGRPGHVIAFELKLADGTLKGAAKDEFYPDNKITVELHRAK